MVKLNKIVTKTGDSGTTGLGNGKRVVKHHNLIEFIGLVDTANCYIGLAKNYCSTLSDIGTITILTEIQQDLFDLGADVITPQSAQFEHYRRITPEYVERLEMHIKAINDTMEPLESFILPGGNMLSSHLHIARASVRTAERAGWRAWKTSLFNRTAMQYLNRLSDLLFVLARKINNDDHLWEPNTNA